MRRSSSVNGMLAASGAFLLWGLLPLYWKLLGGVSSAEILCHRIVWSAVFVGLLVVFTRRWKEVREAMRSRRTLCLMLCSGTLIGVNWWLYIWAVNNGHVLETSLGYYITPLVNMVLGVLVFHDRLRPIQFLAIGLAAAGVVYRLVLLGQLPWVALTLAFSFALYGLLRKVAQVESIPGLMFETLVLMPVVLVWLLSLHLRGEGAFGHAGVQTSLLLIGGGVVSSLPLMCFAYGARRIPFTTLGILQYIAPSIAFLLGVFFFREPFETPHLISFLCIWSALVLYTGEGLWHTRRYRRV